MKHTQFRHPLTSLNEFIFFEFSINKHIERIKKERKESKIDDRSFLEFTKVSTRVASRNCIKIKIFQEWFFFFIKKKWKSKIIGTVRCECGVMKDSSPGMIVDLFIYIGNWNVLIVQFENWNFIIQFMHENWKNMKTFFSTFGFA